GRGRSNWIENRIQNDKRESATESQRTNAGGFLVRSFERRAVRNKRLLVLLIGGIAIALASIVILVRFYSRDLGPTARIIDTLVSQYHYQVKRELYSDFIANLRESGSYEKSVAIWGDKLQNPTFVINDIGRGKSSAAPGVLAGDYSEIMWDFAY